MHRDLKPQNIMLDNNYNIKLVRTWYFWHAINYNLTAFHRSISVMPRKKTNRLWRRKKPSRELSKIMGMGRPTSLTTWCLCIRMAAWIEEARLWEPWTIWRQKWSRVWRRRVRLIYGHLAASFLRWWLDKCLSLGLRTTQSSPRSTTAKLNGPPPWR